VSIGKKFGVYGKGAARSRPAIVATERLFVDLFADGTNLEIVTSGRVVDFRPRQENPCVVVATSGTGRQMVHRSARQAAMAFHFGGEMIAANVSKVSGQFLLSATSNAGR
jgi:hypothetical protein